MAKAKIPGKIKVADMDKYDMILFVFLFAIILF